MHRELSKLFRSAKSQTHLKLNLNLATLCSPGITILRITKHILHNLTNAFTFSILRAWKSRTGAHSQLRAQWGVDDVDAIIIRGCQERKNSHCIWREPTEMYERSRDCDLCVVSGLILSCSHTAWHDPTPLAVVIIFLYSYKTDDKTY